MKTSSGEGSWKKVYSHNKYEVAAAWASTRREPTQILSA